MPARRTKRDKQKAKHNFSINWDGGLASVKFEPGVNRQLKSNLDTTSHSSHKTKNAVDSVQAYNLSTIKKDITKSLVLAGFILASEIMIYLIWK